MAIGLVTAVLPVVGKILDKVIPDPAEKAKAQLEVLKLEQEGAFKELDAQLARDLQQIELNKVEASDTSLFKSGWRPFIGWTCGGGLAYQFLLSPIYSYTVQLVAYFMDKDMANYPLPPTLDLETLLTLLFGMLGLGAYRTYERVQGKIPMGK